MNVVVLPENLNGLAIDGGRQRFQAAYGRKAKQEEDTATGARTRERHLSDDIIGAKAECGWAYWHTKFWHWDHPPLTRRGEVKAADFDGWIDIKAIYPHCEHLLLQERDPAERAYVLAKASVDSRIVIFIAWAYGREVKAPEFWEDHEGNGRPCYWIPERRENGVRILHPIETFPKTREL